ncbi:DNA primase [Pelagovum pacificum]|uniref:DNA primase n=1 Tax=Pelagovum pacificum TaxID=2588711 RepID=A0A5C5GA22_9RHOB|nr:DNA primase [Pelagovum pacificum]QQA41542.1 DNA primase [Pelagovum pacificum]TNY30822.1 DNA primase [Pelagovum pacificum]
MSLPPAFFDELRSRLSLAQVVGRKVMWDNRKSNAAKGDLWAPCPFHQEKTASFHVDDRKGFYYCFGCHAKGDAISFVRETENVDFIEAVKILAGEVGLQVPEADPRAQQQADQRTRLTDVMEEAVKYFRLQLKTGAAADARDYLKRRGLSEDAQERWQIGFAPPGWQGLSDSLRGKGIAPDLLDAAGLTRKSDRGKEPYDVFRNRIMFPIRDPRGRCIAFGGRAMDPNDNAKYLNSPETALFDKSRTLYNHGPAREAAGKGAPLIVAEGYMDVIALSEHGFGAAVAPLGTAVTEHQLAHLWRMADEPVIALDGDTAGVRAARKVVSLALPMLQPGKSLRFVLLPDGQDPDDLLKAKGPAAMAKLLDEADPMVRVIWAEATENKSFDSPERKAALDHALSQRTAQIPDQGLRRHYDDALRQLKWELFRPARTPRRGGGFRRDVPATARTSTRNSMLATGVMPEDHLREAVILATFVITPGVLPDFLGELEQLSFSGPGHAALAHALLHIDPETDIRPQIEARLGPDALEALLSHTHVALTPAVRRPGDVEAARLCLAEELAKLNARRGHRREMQEAEEDIRDGLADEHVTARLAQSGATLQRAGSGTSSEDRTEFEVGANGARISRDERARFDDLLAQINFEKRPDGAN